MKGLNDFLNDYKDYKKIVHTGGSLIVCKLYNPNSKKVASFVVDDYEYTYGEGLISRDYDLETLEYIRHMPIDSEALNHYKNHVLKEITEGSVVEVIKGKKYPIGLRGTVIGFYTYIVPNTCGKVRVQYAILNSGEKINVKNLKLIEC